MAGSTISGGSSSTGTGKSGGGKRRKNHTHTDHTQHPAATRDFGNGHGANGHGANGNSANGHGGNGNSGNGNSGAIAAARMYRVTIDVRKIQSNVYANEGGRLSELAVRNWLRSVGFHPEAGGRTWLGDVESMSRLDKSEIVRSERLHRAG